MIFARGRSLVADGAMATNLFARGLRPGDPAELWNEIRPAQVMNLHRAFLEAGADLLLTNSFGGHPHRLEASALGGKTAALNEAAAVLARAAAASTGRTVLVAGAVGPTGERIAPPGALEGFRTQMRALARGGVDLLWIETMSYSEETRLAAQAASEVGLPYAVTASFGADGQSLGGLDAAAFASLAAGLPVRPVLIGANCGSGADALLRDLALMRRTASHLPLVAKASAGLPQMRGGTLVYPMTPADMAHYARGALDAGVQIVGGCCGATPAHVAAIKEALVLARPHEAS